MNIGILGWWRAGNQGDFAIRRNLEQVLAPHHVVPIDMPFELTRDELDRLNLLDFLILGGGGLFQDTPPLPFDTFDEWGTRLKTPIGVLGVGIDTVAPRYRPAVNALVEQTRFFYVRDQESQTLVQHPKVQVMPDVSFISPFPQSAPGLAAPSQPVCGVNLRAAPSLDVDHWIAALHRLPVRLRAIPFSTFSRWREIEMLRQLDPDCPSAFDPSLYQGLDLMVGTALHSIVFAIQAAIPIIAIVTTPKVHRLLTELDLGEWMLGKNDWDKLPELVHRALECREQLTRQLHDITVRMTRAARGVLAGVTTEIERTAETHQRAAAKVSIVVLGSASDKDNRLTLTSCVDQTYDNIEIVFAGDHRSHDVQLPASEAPAQVRITNAAQNEALPVRLGRALDATQGDYVTWVAAGDYYAPDAINCMVVALERNTRCDMVFTDYYTLHAMDYVADAHFVEPASKLFRTNVIGPCFLFKRGLAEGVGPPKPDGPDPTYDFWLRAAQSFCIRPIHARLFFAQVLVTTYRNCEAERQVRRQWRSTQPWPLRVFWRIVDSSLFEDMILVRLLTARRKIKAHQAFRMGHISEGLGQNAHRKHWKRD